MSNKKILFSLQQFFHVGIFAYFIAFLPIYLKYINFNSEEIVMIGIVGILIMMLSNFITVEFLNRFFKTSFTVNFMNLLAIISYILFISTHNKKLIFITWAVHIFSRVSNGVIMDTWLVREGVLGRLNFERIRVWGSIGFIVMSAVLGFIYKNYSAWLGSCFIILPLVVVFIISLIAFRDHSEEKDEDSKPSSLDIFSLSAQSYLLFFVVCLSWLSHAPLYTYLSLYLEEVGYSSNIISLLWNVGVLSEVIMFLLYSKLNRFFSHLLILKISLILTLLRWLLLASTSNFLVLLFAQFLHSFTYASMFLASMKLAYQILPEQIKDKSQGYLGFFGVGLGSLLGRIVLSMPIFYISSYALTPQLFLYAVGLTFVAFLVSLNIKSIKN